MLYLQYFWKAEQKDRKHSSTAQIEKKDGTGVEGLLCTHFNSSELKLWNSEAYLQNKEEASIQTS